MSAPLSDAQSRHNLRRRAFSLGGIGGVGLLCLAGLNLLTAQDAPTATPAATKPADAAAPTTATVALGTLRQTYSVVGELHAHTVANLGAQVSGRVKELLVDTGDRVHQGQVLVRLDSTFFDLDIAQQEAALKAADQRVITQQKSQATAKLDIEQAELALTDARLQMDRMKNLWQKPNGQEPSVPRKSYDDAVTHTRQAELAVAAAQARAAELEARIAEATVAKAPLEAALAYAKQRLAETEIHAPFDACVTRRLVAPGDSVTSAPATTLLELQDLAHLDLDFNVPQGMQAKVGEKTVVYYTLAGLPGEFSAPVDRILPLGDDATRTYRCRVKIDNAAGTFRPGLLVQVKLTQQEKTGVLVAPASALKPTSAGWQVLVQKAGAFVPQTVEVGLRTEQQVEIVSGLKPGDTIQTGRE